MSHYEKSKPNDCHLKISRYVKYQGNEKGVNGIVRGKRSSFIREESVVCGLTGVAILIVELKAETKIWYLQERCRETSHNRFFYIIWFFTTMSEFDKAY